MKLELDKINPKLKTLEEATKVIDQLINIIIEFKNENDSLENNSITIQAVFIKVSSDFKPPLPFPLLHKKHGEEGTF